MKHDPLLDGWRGLAIVLLLVGHFHMVPAIAGREYDTSRVGVEFFFVLSGRLMAEILFVQAAPLGHFYWRRVSRIFPALWVFVGVMLLATSVWRWLDVDAWTVLKAVTFTINYFPGPPSIGHIWSLCVEEHAYVVLSVVALLSRRLCFKAEKILLLLAGLCMANGAVQTWGFGRSYFDVYWHSDVRMASVFSAAAIYLILKHKSVFWFIPVAAGLAGFVVSMVGHVPDPVKYTIGTTCLAISVATLKEVPGWSGPSLSSPMLTTLGLWSFSLYLWQEPFFAWQPYADRSTNGIGLIASFIVATGCFYIIEKPTRAYLNALRKAFLLPA